ncbi:MAG: TrkA family potassium uptake protein [Pseudomonadota bacterium]|nr:TrkA family potassium uptake protein [Pseudomonadota bacterium]
MKRKEFGIVGLGKFGLSLGQALRGHGQTVIGVDSDHEKVKEAAEILDQVYQADAMHKAALQQLGFGELPEVVVSTGHSMEASILIVMFLKELGCRRVTVKAISLDHEKVLKKVGADKIIFPERYAAEQLAARLAVPGLVDYLPLGRNVVLREFVVEKWEGQTLRNLNLTNVYGMQVVAMRSRDAKEFGFVPRADTVLQKGDVLAAIGRAENLEKLES